MTLVVAVMWPANKHIVKGIAILSVNGIKNIPAVNEIAISVLAITKVDGATLDIVAE